MNEKIQFTKVKNILSAYWYREHSVSDMEQRFDNAKKIARNLFMHNIICNSKNDLGNHKAPRKLNRKIIDETYMTNIKYNQEIVSSLAFVNNANLHDTIKYIFKEAPKKIKNEAIYQYSKRFNLSLIKLLDEDSKNKYIFILYIIDENRLNKRIVSEVIIKNKIYKMIFADLFIYEDTWYINVFDVDKNRYEIINQKDITKITILKNELQIVNIDYKLIEKQTIKFVKKSDIQEISIKLSQELLNSIVNLDLLDDYTVYEEIRIQSNLSHSNRDSFMQLGSVMIGTQTRYNKVVLENINEPVVENIISKYSITTNNLKKHIYKVDIKTSKSKFEILMKLFSSKFQIVSKEYKNKCYCCNR